MLTVKFLGLERWFIWIVRFIRPLALIRALRAVKVAIIIKVNMVKD